MMMLEYDLPVQLLCFWRDFDLLALFLCLKSAPHLGTLLGDMSAIKLAIGDEWEGKLT